MQSLKFNDYVAELRKLALTCGWSDAQLADSLRDKFMMGLYNECLLHQLLTHDHKKSLDNLLQHALMFETAKQESLKRAETSTDNSTTMNSFKQQSKKGIMYSQMFLFSAAHYYDVIKVVGSTRDSFNYFLDYLLEDSWSTT